MSNTYLLAIDQGTTSSRAIVFNARGEAVHVAQKELTQHYPQAGWVEHDAEEIWADTLAAAQEVIEKAGGASKIAAIGITNQRETTILWDRKTGKPVHNALVWQDRRTAAFCQGLRDAGHEQMVAAKTGLLIDPYFSCSKTRWALDNVSEAKELLEQGRLAFGTVDCFLLWRLTGGAVHATDVTNAARTGLYNIVTQEWDEELLALYDVPDSILPAVKENVADFGQSAAEHFGAPIQIGGMAGDQHAALIGQGCFETGMMKATYGTGCFALMNIGSDFKVSQNRLLTTPAYKIDGQMAYAVEGSIFMAGATVQWLRDELGVIDAAADTESLACSVLDNGGVYMVPAFAGLGAPHWQADARAAIFGLTRGSGKAHIVRAALEAQAYQTMDLLSAMESDSGIAPSQIRVDGGLVANKFVCQFLADVTRAQIDVPHNTETTALGAAFLAGLYAGVYDGLGALESIWQREKAYEPLTDEAETAVLYETWLRYVASVIQVAE